MTGEYPAFIGNFRGGRSVPIDTIVIHTTEATFYSAVQWFAQDHKPFQKGPTSAHYVVGQQGQVARCVNDEDTAFHAGNFPVNLRSIGIECEGHADEQSTWTQPMFDALLDLCAVLVKKHRIPVDRSHIFGHCDVPDPFDPKLKGGVGHNVDPGPWFPWDRFIEALRIRTTTQGDVA
jgi:N-acetyl-anhydromuramyl-L-alanine amidase AmpD